MKSPFISVIIPVKEHSYYLLYEGLPSFDAQTYKHFEVLVMVNEHAQYDLTLLKQYRWLRIIPTGTITRPAQKRDIGAQKAKGDYLAFIDDDAYPHKGWLALAAAIIKKGNYASVCGPGVLAPHSSFWENVFDSILTSAVGSGQYTYRFIPQKERFVDDYPSMNFFVSKKLFEAVGGFNNDYWPGEDSKLCNDIVYTQKENIYYSPRVVVYHHRRNNVLHYLRQHGSYGYHRGAFAAVGDRNSLRISYAIPSLFLVYCVALPFLIVISSIWIIPLLLYSALASILVLQTYIAKKDFAVAITTPMVLFLTHMAYAGAYLKGLVVGFTKKGKIYP